LSQTRSCSRVSLTPEQLVKEKSVAALICLQVVKGSEILEVLYGLPDIREYLFSLYECKYEQFFSHLGKPFIVCLLGRV